MRYINLYVRAAAELVREVKSTAGGRARDKVRLKIWDTIGLEFQTHANVLAFSGGVGIL